MRYLVIVAAWLAATVASADAVDLAEARLALMRDVAAYKFVHNRPIVDLAREARVIEAAESAGLMHGLVVDDVRALFSAQIEAAKVVQRYWFDRWSAGDGPNDAPDLVADLRPQLIELGEATLSAVARSGCCAEGATIDVAGLDQGAALEVLRALAAIEAYPNRLTQVLDSGVLRVGTTGDYLPFSFRADADGEYVGADIDLARDLADSLAVDVVFVRTTWPNLLRDLAAGHFDVAMSGVSRTLPRQRSAFFTRAYHVGGKTPIARCKDAKRYRSVDRINHPDVRVVVNPGGTNERFVDNRLPDATKRLHDDNRTIFDRIIAGDADVMVTDRIEVTLQSARHEGELCSTTADNFTYQEKAYLLPQDPAWHAYADAWLTERLRDGTVAAALARHTH